MTGFVTKDTYTDEQAEQTYEISTKQTAEPFSAPSHVGAIGVYVPLAHGGPAIIFRYSGLADVDPRTKGTLPDTDEIQFFKPDGTPLMDSIEAITSFNDNRDMYIRVDFGNNELPEVQPYYIVVI